MRLRAIINKCGFN